MIAKLATACFAASVATLCLLVPAKAAGCIGSARWLAIPVSAAIGYLTNWLAIEMLFLPYEKTWRHPFALLTLGFWRQGLLPRNKHILAGRIATAVSTKLLDADKMVEELRQLIPGLLRDAWRDGVAPAFLSRETLDETASAIVAIFRRKSSDIVAFLQPKIASSVVSALEEKGGYFAVFAPNVKFFLQSPAASETLVKLVQRWLDEPETKKELAAKIAECVSNAKDISSDGFPIPKAVLASVQTWFDSKGREKLSEALNVEGRVREAIDNMDARQFHILVRDATHEHLSAIQILGYFLGAAIGALQLL